MKSLSNGTKKMSKSSESKFDTINMLDTDDDIYRKIKNAKTQTSEGIDKISLKCFRGNHS